MAVEAGGERYVATYAQTFADVTPGELLVYQDAYRTLALAVNRGDAAGTLGDRRRTPRCGCGRDDRHARGSTTG